MCLNSRNLNNDPQVFHEFGGIYGKDLSSNVWVPELEGLEQCSADFSRILGGFLEWISRAMFGRLNFKNLNSVPEIFQEFEVISGRDLSSNVYVSELEGLEQCSGHSGQLPVVFAEFGAIFESDLSSIV